MAEPLQRKPFLGVISDTHGLLRPRALEALSGASLILHAGDVGKPEILDALRAIAPVTAVRGNVDRGSWAEALPESATVGWQGQSIFMIHDLKELGMDPKAAGISALISGHTHKPVSRTEGGVLYLNPGSAGPRRFRLPICLARLNWDAGVWHVEFVSVDAD